MMSRLLSLILLLTAASVCHAQTIATELTVERVSTLIRTETEQFVSQFKTMTGKPAKVVADYYPAVEKPILAIRLTDAEVPLAEPLLQARYGKFVGSLSSFLLATRSRLVLSKATVEEYLSAVRKAGPRCGEYPCVQGCSSGGCAETCGPCR